MAMPQTSELQHTVNYSSTKYDEKIHLGMSLTGRVPHGYRFTRSASKTGTVGTGTVLDFRTPQHTVYPYRGVTGIHGLIT